jgi:hypothetical protein
LVSTVQLCSSSSSNSCLSKLVTLVRPRHGRHPGPPLAPTTRGGAGRRCSPAASSECVELDACHALIHRQGKPGSWRDPSSCRSWRRTACRRKSSMARWRIGIAVAIASRGRRPCAWTPHRMGVPVAPPVLLIEVADVCSLGRMVWISPSVERSDAGAARNTSLPRKCAALSEHRGRTQPSRTA